MRVLAQPCKAGPLPSQGCLRDDSPSCFDSIAAASDASCSHDEGTLDESYVRWRSCLEEQLADMHGLQGRDLQRMCCRAAGARLVMRPALGKPGTGTAKASAISIAWRTVAIWLARAHAGFTAGAPAHVCNRARRCRFLLGNYDWAHLGNGRHAVAMRRWMQHITPAVNC